MSRTFIINLVTFFCALFATQSAFAAGTYILDVENIAGERITVDWVKYKLPNTLIPSWELLNFGDDVGLSDDEGSRDCQEAWDGSCTYKGYSVNNALYSNEKTKWKLRYKCTNGGDWHTVTSHSDKGSQWTSGTRMRWAVVQDCDGSVEFADSLSEANGLMGGDWSEWLDRDDPGTIYNDTGDDETIVSHYVDGNLVCLQPTAIECRRVSDGLDYSETGEEVFCDTTVGLLCKNGSNIDVDGCSDYEVRYFCD